MLARRGALELWAGRLDEAAAAFQAGARSASRDTEYERAECLGQLALLEAFHGRLSSAVEHADEATEILRSGRGDLAGRITPAAGLALASVHLQRGDTQEAHAQLKLAEAALRTCPDRLVSALACMVAAQRHLAEGRTGAALEMIQRARQDWAPAPPGWLEGKLAVLESRACAAAGDIPAAIAAARRADPESVPEAAAALASAWLASGDPHAARHALETAAPGEVAQHTSLAGWLVDARLSYRTGDRARGRRSLERALRLARPEQIRLPFAMERAWIRQVLRHDSEMAEAYGDLLEPGLASPAAAAAQKGQTQDGQAGPVVVERLTEREREVLIHLSRMLSTAEIATEMYLSVNTVKTHLRSIYRKLSVAHRSEAVRRARQLELI
jgi:LuxR family maltose regulon positive regulatory protein